MIFGAMKHSSRSGVRPLDQRTMARLIAVVGGFCAIGVFGFYALTCRGSPVPLDINGVPLGRDFLNTWFYGHAFFDPHPGEFYDRVLYEKAIDTLLPINVVSHVWSYPPPFLIIAAPFSLASYTVALAIWTVTGVAVLGVVARAQGARWITVAAILLSPAVLATVVAGQVSLFCGAVMLIALDQLDRRPRLSGLLIAMLVIKPQIALLFPILLIASRRWTVLVAAIFGVVAIVLTSLALNGPDIWVRFVTIGMPSQAADMRATTAILATASTTMTSAATMSGLPHAAVVCLQAVVTALGICVVAYVSSRKDGSRPWLEPFVFLACTAFAAPYLLVHDLVALTAGLLIASCRYNLYKLHPWILAIVFMPTLQGALGAVNIHVTIFIPIAFALWLVAKARPALPMAAAS